jgi:cob(I)alamin adenosyltransferase
VSESSILKIYTKTGDKGQTSLVGGKRVNKNHPRIEAYGTVDELMAHTALLMDMLTNSGEKDFLLWVLERQMTASAVLAAEGEIAKKLPEISISDIAAIEIRIDEINSVLEAIDRFILPGGHVAVSQCHVARTVCRRAERKIFDLIENGYDVPTELNKFINRLSDYFFVLSRKIAKDFDVSTKKWR